jgi:hypothetical protein
MRCAVPIVGERPKSGFRIALERAREGGPPWCYEGTVDTPEASLPLRVIVAEDGEVDVHGASDLVENLAEKVRLLVRAVYRQSDGEAPTRRIVRWRGEK